MPGNFSPGLSEYRYTIIMASSTSPLSPDSKPVFVEESLYEVHQKVHPRAVSGVFATWRWALDYPAHLLRRVLVALEWTTGGAAYSQ